MVKKKIAIIIDSKGWAFDNIANKIKQNINEYDIDIITGEYFEGNMIKLFLCCKNYDLIHFMWRGYLSLMNKDRLNEYVNSLGMTFEEFEKEFVFSKIITFSVCDELYLDGEDKWRTNEIMKYAKGYFVSSKRLWDIYNMFNKKPYTIIHDGVDLKMFKPKNLERLKDLNRNIVIGWVGNSKFVDSDGDNDMKGVEGIIKPAIEELQKQNYNVSLKLADRAIKKIDIKDMPDFYNSIDIFVCASKNEGTPLTVLEAMATGIPVVSTNVGVVQEILGEYGKKYILKDRTVDCLVEKLKVLLNNQADFFTLSQENLNQIKQWDWSVISKQYQSFFEKFLCN
ncbi:MAG TPA: hypothetical protein DEP51_04730 [Clostridiales bacterium]|nr:hypothetical protein [Clostridiales bacterium]